MDIIKLFNPDTDIARQLLNKFLASKKGRECVAHGWVLDRKISCSGQTRKMIFLHEDALFNVLLPTYSRKSIAQEDQDQLRFGNIPVDQPFQLTR